MTEIRTLQDLEAWQAARELAAGVYAVSQSGPMPRDRSFTDQIRRASVSTMSNIAEAYGRRTSRDKARILDISRGSAKEVESLLYLGRDIGYLDERQFDSLLNMSNKAIGLLSGWRRSLRK